MLFSATLSDAILRVIGDTLHDPVHVDVAPSSTPVSEVEQYAYPVSSMQKTELMVALLKQTSEYRAIVFTRTKRRADRLAAALNSSGVEAATIHSDLSQSTRTATLEGFRNGKHALLISTDVMARGIDVDGITHVINYDAPERPDDYVHRIGRTARAGETGVAITLISYEEMSAWRDIEAAIDTVVPTRDVEGFEYQDRVVPAEDRETAATAPRRVFSGGVGRRGGRSRTRRF